MKPIWTYREFQPWTRWRNDVWSHFSVHKKFKKSSAWFSTLFFFYSRLFLNFSSVLQSFIEICMFKTISNAQIRKNWDALDKTKNVEMHFVYSKLTNSKILLPSKCMQDIFYFKNEIFHDCLKTDLFDKLYIACRVSWNFLKRDMFTDMMVNINGSHNFYRASYVVFLSNIQKDIVTIL